MRVSPRGILNERGDPAANEAYKRGAELGSAEAAGSLANNLRERGELDQAVTAWNALWNWPMVRLRA